MLFLNTNFSRFLLLSAVLISTFYISGTSSLEQYEANAQAAFFDEPKLRTVALPVNNEKQQASVLGDSDLDTDGDGLSDYEERAIYQTYWYDSDTDKDGFSDYEEVRAGFSPKQKNLTMQEADTDNDGLNDAWEIALGTNLMVRDTDGDGYLDGTEVYSGFDPTDSQPTKIEKKIVVSDEDLNLKFYFGDVLLMDIPVSTGKSSTPTPHGEFEILAKVPVKHYAGPGYDYPNTLYNLHFTTDYWRYYIHGAYWHNNFGIRPVSGGCVNVRYEDMEDLYNFTNIGTTVVIN